MSKPCECDRSQTASRVAKQKLANLVGGVLQARRELSD
jgi:hypothetical protein